MINKIAIVVHVQPVGTLLYSSQLLYCCSEIWSREFMCLLSAVPPLFVIEFLHRIMDIFTDYFGECNEVKIKEYYVIVYEVCFMHVV